MFLPVLSIFDVSVGKVYVVVPRQNPDIHVGTIHKFSNTMIQLDFFYARENARWHVEIPRIELESSIVRDFASLLWNIIFMLTRVRVLIVIAIKL